MNTSPAEFSNSSLDEKIDTLYEQGTFITSIRYYRYKVNLYLLNNFYVEVFVNHKRAEVEKIHLLDMDHSRVKFYCDQVRLIIDK
jgi:hypothetical protein